MCITETTHTIRSAHDPRNFGPFVALAIEEDGVKKIYYVYDPFIRDPSQYRTCCDPDASLPPPDFDGPRCRYHGCCTITRKIVEMCPGAHGGDPELCLYHDYGEHFFRQAGVSSRIEWPADYPAIKVPPSYPEHDPLYLMVLRGKILASHVAQTEQLEHDMRLPRHLFTTPSEVANRKSMKDADILEAWNQWQENWDELTDEDRSKLKDWMCWDAATALPARWVISS